MIDQKTIEWVAHLARLKINIEEGQQYGLQLSKVLTHFQQIEKINTTGVEPLTTPIEIELYFRPDEVVKEYTSDQMVANACEKSGHLFKVPPVV